MKQFLIIVFLAANLIWGASPTLACGFDELALGICPQFDAESPLGPAPNEGEVGVLDARYVWSKWPEFKGKSTISLKVCIFSGLAQTVASNAVDARDFSKDKAAFERVGVRVEKAAEVWSNASGIVGGKPYKSRLVFSFRGGDGKIRACEDSKTPDWHIAIVIGKKATDFYTGHGFEFLELSRKERRATMLLYGLGTTGKAANAQHEFGHALGFTHEMVHRDWEPCVKAFLPKKYALRKGIAEERALKNVNNLVKSFAGVELDATDKMDHSSIMTYAFVKRDFDQAALTGDEACLFNRNTELSDGDVNLYLQNYGSPVAN